MTGEASADGSRCKRGHLVTFYQIPDREGCAGKMPGDRLVDDADGKS